MTSPWQPTPWQVPPPQDARATVRFHPAPGWPDPPSQEWLPPAGWQPDAAWPPAPEGWSVLVADAPLDRPSFFPWRASVSSRSQVQARQQDRRPTGWEIWLLLAVFPGSAVVAAVIGLVMSHLSNDPGDRLPVEIAGHTVVSALLDTGLAVFEFVPAAVAAYLLFQSGGGLRAIGLDRDNVLGDLSRSAKLFTYAYIGPFIVAGALLAGLSDSDVPRDPTSWVYLVPSVLLAVAAGVVEEITVLGYLTHRLEQRGWSGPKLVAVLLAVRVSYHVYYGLGVLPIVLWGLVSIVLYRRRRRLLPFIVVHAMWDTSASVGAYLHGSAQALPIVALIGVTLVLLTVGRTPARCGPKGAQLVLADS